MTATSLYRIAAVLLILFAAGHTFGFLSFTPPTPEGVAVRDAMNNVHFQIKGGSYSYGEFYRGFGLFATAYLLFSAWLAWVLSRVAVSAPRAIGTLGWAFCVVQVASLILSAIYFSAAPVVFSGLVTACLGWAAWQVQEGKTQSVAMTAVESHG